MDYHMAFDPDLGLDAQDFVAAWNDAAECRALAEARLIPRPPRGFPLDPQLIQQGLVLLTGAAGARATTEPAGGRGEGQGKKTGAKKQQPRRLELL